MRCSSEETSKTAKNGEREREREREISRSLRTSYCSSQYDMMIPTSVRFPTNTLPAPFKINCGQARLLISSQVTGIMIMEANLFANIYSILILSVSYLGSEYIIK